MTGSPRDVVLIGDSARMCELRATIARVAPTRLPVLIEGETGTGKELVAALLHCLSGRSGNHVAFNVCAIGDAMFEDALFGHVRGAYTGAVRDSLGFLREANGGTAFFDEISGLSMSLQAKLLRALETGVFRPIGATRDAQSDFRIVSATNERLADLVDRGAFRADVRHRLSGVVLMVPPLRERGEDIPSLVAYFARRTRGEGAYVTPAAIRLLEQMDWPGNIRELKQVVDGAAAFAGQSIDERAVELSLAHRSSGPRAIRVIAQPVERQRLVAALESSAWNTEIAAGALGVHRATIYRRMKRHGIDTRGIAAP